jgi:hypothetical protein
MKPVPLDALDAMPASLTLDVPIKLRNHWRIRLALYLMALASLLLRAKIKVNLVEPEMPLCVICSNPIRLRDDPRMPA